MCNINIVMRRSKRLDITPFLMAVSSNSFASNDNGEGIWTDSDNQTIKNDNKIDYYTLRNKINDSNTIITHQRISTSGHVLEFNQPFQNQDFVFVHNGVINKFLKAKGSDSWGFWLSFNETFKKKKMLRDFAIIETIKELLNDESGSFSIFIHDKVQGRSYYFKNSSTDIHFYRHLGILYITTNSANERFLTLLGDGKTKELEIKDYKIYGISDTEESDYLKIDILDEIKEKVSPFKSWSLNDEEVCENCFEQINGPKYTNRDGTFCLECYSDKTKSGGKEDGD